MLSQSRILIFSIQLVDIKTFQEYNVILTAETITVTVSLTTEMLNKYLTQSCVTTSALFWPPRVPAPMCAYSPTDTLKKEKLKRRVFNLVILLMEPRASCMLSGYATTPGL